MALFDSQLSLLINAGSNYLNAGESPQRWGNAHPSIVPYQVFRGGDGRHFVAAIGTDALWFRFLRVIDATETLGADSRFRTNALRTEHRLVLIPALIYDLRESPGERMAEAAERGGYPGVCDPYGRRSCERPTGIGARIDRGDQAPNPGCGAQYRQPGSAFGDPGVVPASTSVAGRAQR